MQTSLTTMTGGEDPGGDGDGDDGDDNGGDDGGDDDDEVGEGGVGGEVEEGEHPCRATMVDVDGTEAGEKVSR